MKLCVGLILATMVLGGGMLLSGVVLAKTIKGGPGPNKYTGSNGADYIKGNGGSDNIDGKNGADTISGGTGSDLLHGGHGNDWVKGDSGTDTAWGDQGKDDLFAEHTYQASIQAAKVKGGRKPDKLLGGPGNDTIRAKDGKRDIIRGGPGRDTAYVDQVDNVTGVEVERCPGGCNEPPVAKDDSYSVNEDTVLRVVDGADGVLSNDTDADNPNNTNAGLTVKDADSTTPGVQPETGPAHGTLTLNADGSFEYRHTGRCSS